MGSKTRARRSRLRSSFFFLRPSPEHSAHIGREVEVHYRWHPLFGNRVRWYYRERRAAGDLVHVEIGPGEVIAVPAWMLDPSACAGMVLGRPRVTLGALIDLHCLLTERGFRRDSSTDSNIGEEKQDGQFAKTDRRDPAHVPHRVAPAQHCVRDHSDAGDTPYSSGVGRQLDWIMLVAGA